VYSLASGIGCNAITAIRDGYERSAERILPRTFNVTNVGVPGLACDYVGIARGNALAIYHRLFAKRVSKGLMSLRVHQVSSCGTRNCILGNPLCEMSLIRHAGKVSETVAYLERPSDVWQYYLELCRSTCHISDLSRFGVLGHPLKKNSQRRPSANFPAPLIVQETERLEKWKPRGE